jgi:hypothetical protein
MQAGNPGPFGLVVPQPSRGEAAGRPKGMDRYVSTVDDGTLVATAPAEAPAFAEILDAMQSRRTGADVSPPGDAAAMDTDAPEIDGPHGPDGRTEMDDVPVCVPHTYLYAVPVPHMAALVPDVALDVALDAGGQMPTDRAGHALQAADSPAPTGVSLQIKQPQAMTGVVEQMDLPEANAPAVAPPFDGDELAWTEPMDMSMLDAAPASTRGDAAVASASPSAAPVAALRTRDGSMPLPDRNNDSPADKAAATADRPVLTALPERRSEAENGPRAVEPAGDIAETPVTRTQAASLGSRAGASNMQMAVAQAEGSVTPQGIAGVAMAPPSAPEHVAIGRASIPVVDVAPQLAHEVKRLTLLGSDRAVLQLEPPELGRLDIRLALTDSRVSLHVTVASDAVRAILEAGRSQLEMELAQHGLQSTGLSIQVDQQGGREGSQESPGRGAATPWRNSVADRTPDPVALDLDSVQRPGARLNRWV